MRGNSHIRFGTLILLGAASGAAWGQCQPWWLPGDGIPGVPQDGRIHAMTRWDPDGAGPLAERLVVGGYFGFIGTTTANAIATYDGTTWAPLGGGFTTTSTPNRSTVYALAVLPDNTLVAGGDFDLADGLPANGIARWDGTTWVPLAGGLTGGDKVRSLLVLPSGDLIAGGGFNRADTLVLTNYTARWDGVAWSAMPGLSFTSQLGVKDLALLPDGTLVAGGDFSTHNGLAAWNGTSWAAFPVPLNSGAVVRDFEVAPSGDLIMGGFFTTGGVAARHVARWDGTQWHGFGSTVINGVEAVEVLADGRVVVGGTFSNVGNAIAVWGGSAWQSMGSGIQTILDDPGSVHRLFVEPAGRLLVGGQYGLAGGQGVGGLAAWEAGAWSRIGKGFNAAINAVAALPNGHVVVSGSFRSAGGVDAKRIARWDGVEWHAMGEGLSGETPLSSISPVGFCLAALPNGHVVVGGAFTTAGVGAASNIAIWTGSSWLPMGDGLNNIPRHLAVAPNGDVVAAGMFTLADGNPAPGLARWDGTQWTPMTPPAELGGRITDMKFHPITGELYATNGSTAPYLARFDGTTWHHLATALTGINPNVTSLEFLASGDVVVTGEFTSINLVAAAKTARFNGTNWLPMGGPAFTYRFPESLVRHPTLGVVGAEVMTNHSINPVKTLAYSNGGAWTQVNSGTTWQRLDFVRVNDAAALPSGEIAMVGEFAVHDGTTSAYFARWTPNGQPWIARHPTPEFNLGTGGTITLTATAAAGHAPLQIRWQRETSPGVFAYVSNGPGGASPGGGTVSGASVIVGNAQQATLTIAGATASDSGVYRAEVISTCGSSFSTNSEVHVANPCTPDLTTTAIPGSPGYGMPNGTLNNDDFFYYLNEFAAGNVATCDLTTTAVPGAPGYGVPNGLLNNDDFFYYLTLFSAGC